MNCLPSGIPSSTLARVANSLAYIKLKTNKMTLNNLEVGRDAVSLSSKGNLPKACRRARYQK